MPSFRTRLRAARAAVLTAALLALAVGSLPPTAAASHKRPKQVTNYENSKATVRYDYGAALNYYGHRLCLLANQPSGNREILTGERYSDESYYPSYKVKGTKDYHKQESCPQKPPVPSGHAVRKLRHKNVLIALVESAGNQVSSDSPYSGLMRRAMISENRRIYNRIRNQLLRDHPQMKLVTFARFWKLLELPKRKTVPEQKLKDPPPCMADGSCHRPEDPPSQAR
jgi:hypothetical protein